MGKFKVRVLLKLYRGNFVKETQQQQIVLQNLDI